MMAYELALSIIHWKWQLATTCWPIQRWLASSQSVPEPPTILANEVRSAGLLLDLAASALGP